VSNRQPDLHTGRNPRGAKGTVKRITDDSQDRYAMKSMFSQPQSQSGGNATGLVAGAAMRITTPNPLLPVSGGLGPTAPVKGKRGEIGVRVLFLKQGTTGLAFVGIDALGFPAVLGDRIRAKVTRIPGDNILIGATHTHSAPDYYAFPDGKGGFSGDLKWLDKVCALAADAINEAIDKAKPAVLKVHHEDAQGRIAYNYYAPDLYDRRMAVMQAVGVDGKAIGTLVNYAIHPEVLGNSVGLLSADCIGPMYDAIEAASGGVAVFMNSAQGGMVTADNRLLDKPKDPVRGYWEDARTWEECLRIGKLMASEALRIVAKATPQAAPKLFIKTENVVFPVDSDLLWAVVQASPLKYPTLPGRKITTRISVINVGDAQLVTAPGEALPNIGMYIKRKMKGKTNMVLGLTQDAFGYILTSVDFGSFRRYDYVSQTSLGENTGDILIAAWRRLIDGAPTPTK